MRILLSLYGVILLAQACAATPAGCPSDDARYALSAKYQQDVRNACEPHGPDLDQCPAYPTLKAQYAKDRAAWLACAKPADGGAP